MVDGEHFRPAFDSAPIGMVVIDAEGWIEDVNMAFARILGRTVSSLRTQRLKDLIHPDDAQRDLELLEQVADGSLPYYQAQNRLVHRTGDAVWTRMTVSPTQARVGPRFMVHVEDVTEIRRARDLLERRALYDHLTGLANRTLLLERLEQALQRRSEDSTLACVFLDIDHFKLVNDSLGHHAGDALLQEIATRIQGAVRPGDTVARLGGDEFVVILESASSQAAAEAFVTVIAADVQRPFTVEGHEVVPTVSAGLAIAERGISAESMVRNADTAMYAAKQHGRARVEVFTSELRHDALTKLSIEAELRTAIRDGELAVHYQPVVDLRTREVIAFEALVRWRHPSRGLLLPDDFIAVCEEANLVVPLGAFVISEACRFLADHPDFAGRVFVNVSTRQIGAADLTRVVTHALTETGVDPERLGLEITESGVLIATQAARSDLEGLAKLGVDLIIDDFGTGYSALSSILLNPVSGIKLAREFTMRLGDGSTGDRISSTVATLTSSLDMYGVIEGIESEEQLEIAREHGWALGQGFIFGRPVAAHAIRFDADGRVVLEADPRDTLPSSG